MNRSCWAACLMLVLWGCSSGGDAPDDGGTDAPARYADANLIIISLDTLRADAVGHLGGPSGISPVLDRFAEECVVFTHARSQAPHTAPSHMSLFTSTYPSVHGVQNVAHGKVNGRRSPIFKPLPDTIPLLAEILQFDGMRTVGITEGGNLNPPHGFSRGFDKYTYDLAGVAPQVRLGIQEIDDLTKRDERAFFFWHTYEVHAPYIPPAKFADNWAPGPEGYSGPLRETVEKLQGKPFVEQFGGLKGFWKNRENFAWPEAAYLHGLYKAGVRYTDSELDRLFESLETSGLLDTSVVVLLSDHGEEFYEHGKWQHEQVYEECLRVPLMIRLPDGLGAGRRIDTAVGLIDVMPTVLELLGTDTGELGYDEQLRMQGVSHARAILDGSDVEPRTIISELRADVGQNYEWLVALHDGESNTKYIHDTYRRQKRGEDVITFHGLYDLETDANEQANKLGTSVMAATEGELVEQYELWKSATELIHDVVRDGASQAETEDMPEDQLRSLEALGYLEPGQTDEIMRQRAEAAAEGAANNDG